MHAITLILQLHVHVLPLHPMVTPVIAGEVDLWVIISTTIVTVDIAVLGTFQEDVRPGVIGLGVLLFV